MSGVCIPASFDLAQTLDCGQAFRWQKLEDGSWQGVAFGRMLILRRTEDQLAFSCPAEDLSQIWRAYFDLYQDYEAQRQAVSRLSPALAEAAA